MKKFIDFLTKNDEPVGLRGLHLQDSEIKNSPVHKNPWETPLFVKQGEFYRSLKKIEEKY